MSEVLFIQDLYKEYMGIMYLSAVLKKYKISTDLIIERNIDNILNYISNTRPKIIGFSVITGLHKFPVQVANAIKKNFPDIKIIAGGPHPTFFQDYIQEKPFDAICVGEGEYSLLKYYEYVIGNEKIEKVPNLIYKYKNKIYKNDIMNLIEDLDTLPYPDRDLYDKYDAFKNYPTKMILCLRGCPYHCSYCYNDKMQQIYFKKGRYVRMRAPEAIIEELKYLKRRYGKKLRTVVFSGDVFFYDKNWVIKLLELYAKEIGIPFISNVTANLIDEEIGSYLKKANCKGLYFGIESGNESIRKKVLMKNISDEDIYNAARILRKNGIRYRTYNIIGLPTETIENMFETIYMNVKIKTDYPWCSIFTPYPGTKLYEIAVEAGELDSSFSIDDIPSSFMEKSVLKKREKNLIENLHKFFITAVKFPFLIPLIKKLIKIRPNIFFKLWFGFTYALSIMFSENLKIRDVIKMILENYKFFITRDEKIKHEKN